MQTLYRQPPKWQIYFGVGSDTTPSCPIAYIYKCNKDNDLRLQLQVIAPIAPIAPIDIVNCIIVSYRKLKHCDL